MGLKNSVRSTDNSITYSCTPSKLEELIDLVENKPEITGKAVLEKFNELFDLDSRRNQSADKNKRQNDRDKSFQDNEEIIKFFENSRLFTHLPKNLIQKIVPFSSLMEPEQGSCILKEGEENTRIFFLMNGALGVYVDGEQIHTLRRKGDIVGEMSIISNSSCSASVRIETEGAKLLSIHASHFGNYNAKEREDLGVILYPIFSMILTEKLRLTTEKAKRFEKQQRKLKLANQTLETEVDLHMKAKNELNIYRYQLEEIVEKRTNELKESNIKLEEANVELLELDKLKDDFMATTSHELKTPLTSILGYTETLRDCKLSKKERSRYYNIILDESERLGILIQNTLDVSHLYSGKLEFRFRQTTINNIIEKSIEAVGGLLVDKPELLISFLPLDPDIKFSGDESRLIQVMINLLGNGIKFTGSTGMISITVQTMVKNFIVSVQDQGCGIDKNNLIKVFKKFCQIENQNVLKKGTGLGLTIAEGIVKAHQGKIWAESNDEGALFRFSLPFKL